MLSGAGISHNLLAPNHVPSFASSPHNNASNSTQGSNNFYENTMNSANSSIHKRKSVISSQSTGSSNEVSGLS